MDSYRVVLADDHAMLRQGIKKIIVESQRDVVVVGEAGDGLELLEVLKRTAPDMVILDISMPGLRGIEATREIKRMYPKIKVLILSMHKSIDFLKHSLSAGARGYLLKEDTDSELFSAIETLRRGKTYLSPLLTEAFASEFARAGPGPEHGLGDALTTREREILKLVAEGKSTKAIARALYISANTVKNHRASIMKKLGLNNVAELTKYALQHGYVFEGD